MQVAQKIVANLILSKFCAPRTLEAQAKKERAVLPPLSLSHLARVDVVHQVVGIQPLRKLKISLCVLTHKSSDMLASGHGVQPANEKPAAGGDVNYIGAVGTQGQGAIAVASDGSLGVGHSGQGASENIVGSHSSISFSFGTCIISHCEHFVNRVVLFFLAGRIILNGLFLRGYRPPVFPAPLDNDSITHIMGKCK